MSKTLKMDIHTHIKNIEKDFHTVFDNFFYRMKNRTCDKCGAVMEDNRKKQELST